MSTLNSLSRAYLRTKETKQVPFIFNMALLENDKDVFGFIINETPKYSPSLVREIWENGKTFQMLAVDDDSKSRIVSLKAETLKAMPDAIKIKLLCSSIASLEDEASDFIVRKNELIDFYRIRPILDNVSMSASKLILNKDETKLFVSSLKSKNFLYFTSLQETHAYLRIIKLLKIYDDNFQEWSESFVSNLTDSGEKTNYRSLELISHILQSNLFEDESWLHLNWLSLQSLSFEALEILSPVVFKFLEKELSSSVLEETFVTLSHDWSGSVKELIDTVKNI